MQGKIPSSSTTGTFQSRPPSPLIESILQGSAPKAIRLAAARGALPIPRADLFRVVVILAVDTDQDVRGEAMSSLKSWSNEELLTLAADVDTDPKVLSFLLTWTESLQSLLPKVLSNPSTPLESLLAVARSFSAGNLDL